MLSPYEHVLNGSGTDCEDGTSCAGAVPCPACRWATDRALENLDISLDVEELERMHSL